MSQPTNPKYETLGRIIDRFCQDAPRALASLYRPDPRKFPEKSKQARARAYGHLYLLAKFSLIDFHAREDLITDGEQDGGLDAYHLDHANKKVYLIQFKFHHSANSFEKEAIGPAELMKVEFDHILRGEPRDSLGVRFNKKVRRFQKAFAKTSGYQPFVVLFGSVNLPDARLKKLIGNFPFEIYDSKRVYNELVFGLCAGDYSTPEMVLMEINKTGKAHIALEQDITVQSGRCGIKIVFAPTKEIGRVVARYKNSILRFNPRNYLSLSQNSVNGKIAESIQKGKTNEFSILNNGITILANAANIDSNTGNPRIAHLCIERPQIINGGQTAYTLAEIYEQNKHSLFAGKEVMLKIIQLGSTPAKRTKLIEAISNATNRQTKVDEADRRANSDTLKQIQNKIFEEYGYFFERKRGEFYDGSSAGFLDDEYVIDRFNFLKAYLAFTGDPSSCRSKGERTLFRHDFFSALFPDANVYVRALFAYRVFNQVTAIEKAEKKNRYGWAKYGNALRYGRFAVVAAVGRITPNLSGKENFDAIAQARVTSVLAKWKQFEKQLKKKTTNKDYFADGDEGFDNYYKGKTLNDDIQKFSFT